MPTCRSPTGLLACFLSSSVVGRKSFDVGRIFVFATCFGEEATLFKEIKGLLFGNGWFSSHRDSTYTKFGGNKKVPSHDSMRAPCSGKRLAWLFSFIDRTNHAYFKCSQIGYTETRNAAMSLPHTIRCIFGIFGMEHYDHRFARFCEAGSKEIHLIPPPSSA